MKQVDAVKKILKHVVQQGGYPVDYGPLKVGNKTYTGAEAVLSENHTEWFDDEVFSNLESAYLHVDLVPTETFIPATVEAFPDVKTYAKRLVSEYNKKARASKKRTLKVTW